MNKYYVYLHKLSSTGEIFYIGKGCGLRYKSKSKRSPLWNDKASQGYFYEIYKDNLDETTALELETELIKSIPNLVNSKIGTKVTFNSKDYLEYFQIDPNSPSGLVRTKQTWTRTCFKGNIGNTGCISFNKGKNYWQQRFNNKLIPVHRIIWIIANGFIADNMIVEHIDGDGLNNKLYNLRLVSKEVNGRNKSKRYNNKTGLMGIHIEQGTGYRASASIPNIGQKSKYFSFLKYGKEEALRLAIEWRTAKLKELNEQGAGYTDRHINQG